MDNGLREKVTKMNTDKFEPKVKAIPVEQISANPNNPRGEVEFDQSFERLVSSIKEVGILVPIVVRRVADDKYELVDGERRFLAAQRLRLKNGIPAHVLSAEHQDPRELRKFMFHLHMTREQWEPLAQCKALVEMYPEIDDGIRIENKSEWAKKIKSETWMDERTARDRVHVLAWPANLKTRIYEFDEKHRDRDIYSYVLAIEASIVEPDAKGRRDNHDERHIETRANKLRAALLKKTLEGIETGSITSREQIRELEPLFKAKLPEAESKIASSIVNRLITSSRYHYEDAAAEVERKLPKLVFERPPKPQKLIGSVKTITETIKAYQSSFLEMNIKSHTKRKRLRDELRSALKALASEATDLKERL